MEGKEEGGGGISDDDERERERERVWQSVITILLFCSVVVAQMNVCR